MNFQRPDDVTRLDPRRPTAAETRRWRRQGLWRSLLLWRAATVAALFVAVAAVAAAMLRPVAEPPALLGAALGPVDMLEPYIVTVDTRLGVLRAPGQPAPDPTRKAELWIQFMGEAPIALGQLDPSRPLRIPLPKPVAARLEEGPDVFVTLERLDGKSHSAPTGAVVARGTINPL